MTSTTSTTAHQTRVTPGHLTIVDGPDGLAVWAYVLTTLPGRDVLALTLGTGLYTPVPGVVGVYPVSAGETLNNLNEWTAARDAVAEYFRGTTPAVPPTVPDSEALDRARREGAAEVQARWDRWSEDATETAHRYADDNNLCGEFDRCMEEIGLPPRSRDYTVTLSLNVAVSVGATGRTDDDAADQAIEMFRNDPRAYLEGVDWGYVHLEVDDVEVD